MEEAKQRHAVVGSAESRPVQDGTKRGLLTLCRRRGVARCENGLIGVVKHEAKDSFTK